MSSTDNLSKNYTFEIKFGPYHQKVNLMMNPFNLTMNTLREVAVRFIETMVRFFLNKNSIAIIIYYF